MNTYEVDVTFTVEAETDEQAEEIVEETLRHGMLDPVETGVSSKITNVMDVTNYGK